MQKKKNEQTFCIACGLILDALLNVFGSSMVYIWSLNIKPDVCIWFPEQLWEVEMD